MASIAARHHVILKDQAGAQLAIFDTWRSLSYNKVVNDVGDYELTFIDNGDPRFDLFELDGQIEVWRAVPASGLAWYKDFEAFHRKQSRKIEQDGQRTVTSTGVGYNHLLARRTIAYRHGLVLAEKNDYAEDVMKEFVNENAGPGAGDVTRIISGIFTNFTVQAESGSHTATPVWAGDRAFSNLLDVLQEISAFTLGTTPASRAVDFAVVGNGAGAFQFQTFLDQLGTDHTASSANPVIFAVEMGNVQSAEQNLDRTTEVTAVVVLGLGDRSTQTVVGRTNATAIADSPWNQIEVVRSATENQFVYQLEDAGDGVLQELQKKEGFDAILLQTPTTLYGLHYGLGDKVTFRFNGVDYDKKIISVKTSVSAPDGESLSFEFADI